ncbi:MAG: LysR family transcriptional regulator [Betaproteobacteria bacterium RIFCSPLOWO2_02_FULL_66_14]|nr:MAG: LysR family transcriptional regulator [Betaproteobacteria bacterium RIFCSPLOWO2_02_FULL_66_14]
MTLTELRYIVAVARERHFGRAAETCFVSQPTLSVAIKKLEQELGVVLFERGTGEVSVTPVGQKIVEQAQRVLEDASRIRDLAATGHDPLAGTLRLGAIYTIGPYLLPRLVPILRRTVPSMQLHIQESFTHRLAESLKQGEVDVIVVALPFEEPGCQALPVYDEPFLVAVPVGHPWEKRRQIAADELNKESLLLLGEGHCLRDQVISFCGTKGRSGFARSLEGGSLETIRQMVAGGVGITVLPSTSTAAGSAAEDLIRVRPFARPVPQRRIAIVWRKSFPRPQAIEAIRQAILACDLPGVTKLRPAA